MGGLFCNLSYNACANGTAAFADSETLAFFHSDRGDELYSHFDIIARHAHFGAFRQGDVAGYVGGSEEELRTIAVEERRMTAAFIFGQDIDLSLEFRVRMNRARFSQDLAAFDVFAVDATEQCADVVACFCEVQDLTEHFNARNDGIFRFISEADDFDSVTDFDRTTFDTARSNRTTAGDGEYVFNRHQERFVCRTVRSRDVFVNGFHEVFDGLYGFRIAFQSFEGGTNYDRYIVAREIVGSEKIADFHFYEFNQFRIIDLVSFVEVYNDSRYTNLAGQEDVFTSLGHRAVSSGNDEDSAVHLSSTCDHVFNVIGMSWAVNVSVVTFFCFVLNVSCRNCDTTFSFFWSFVDVFEINCCVSFYSYRKSFCNSSC